MKASEILRQSAKLLEEKGWCRATSVNSLGQHCCIGALGYIYYSESEINRSWHELTVAERELAQVLSQQFNYTGDYTGGSIMHINDDLMHHGGEAIAAMEKAAVNLESRI